MTTKGGSLFPSGEKPKAIQNYSVRDREEPGRVLASGFNRCLVGSGGQDGYKVGLLWPINDLIKEKASQPTTHSPQTDRVCRN